MFAIQVLDRLSVPPYLLLVKPGMRRLLLDDAELSHLLVLGASFWGQAAAAAVVAQGKNAAHLIDLYVLPSYRQAGIGAALLSAVEEQLAQAGIPRIQTLYRPDEHTPAFAALLTRQGWTRPVLSHIVFWTCRAVGFGPWINRYRFRPPYELFAWSDLTETERNRLAERGELGWYPPALSPFRCPDNIWDPESSVGLRYRSEVVGWCLTVREKPDQMLVEILFVDPPLQRLGRGFMLVGEVCRRHAASGGDYVYWRVSPDNEPMLHWSHKVFARDGLVDQYEEWYSEKVLLP